MVRQGGGRGSVGCPGWGGVFEQDSEGWRIGERTWRARWGLGGGPQLGMGLLVVARHKRKEGEEVVKRVHGGTQKFGVLQFQCAKALVGTEAP